METFIYSLISLIIGSLVTIWVSKFYFKKSVNKTALQILLDYESELFWDVDKDVKDEFQLFYKGDPVKQMIEVSFTVINNGNTPIAQPIKPLRLTFKHEYKIYDCQITKIKPKKRDVEAEQKANGINLLFDLLNPSESFDVRMFIEPTHNLQENENIKYDEYDDISVINDLDFGITAMNLSPELPIIKYNKTQDAMIKNDRYYIRTSIFGAITTFFFISIIPIALAIENDLYSIFSQKFYLSYNLIKLFIGIQWIIMFLLILIFVMGILKLLKEKLKN